MGTGGGAGWNSQTDKYRYEEVIAYPDRKEKAKKMLVYNSQPMNTDREITGHPIVDLFLSTDANDGAVFIYLEDVHENGDVTYITEGQFRFIHRKQSSEKPSHVQWGPYHTFNQKDASPVVPGEIFRLGFDLIPTSYLLKKGHSLRLSIAGVDRDHFEFRQFQNTVINVASGGNHPSRIQVPFVEN